MMIISIGLTGLIAGFILGCLLVQEKPIKCPWEFCSYKVPKTPLYKERVIVSEQCGGCGNYISYHAGRGEWVREFEGEKNV